MITINIYYTGENGNAKKFAEEMIGTGMIEQIRAEEGNIRYEYFMPFQDSETILLIDSWESQEAVDIHHKSPMMSKITELRKKYNLHMRVERYISDSNGIPAHDSKFIRN